MPNSNENQIGVGTLLYANNGKYGPCARVVGRDAIGWQVQHGITTENGTFIPNDPHRYEWNWRTRQYELVNRPFFRIADFSQTFWSPVQSVAQEIAAYFRRHWYEIQGFFKYELPRLLEEDRKERLVRG